MKILFAGDVVLNDVAFTLSDEVTALIERCDLVFCNLEAPIANLEVDKAIEKAGPAICQTKLVLETLSKYGFSHVSLANNHILDYGSRALENTISSLKEYNIKSLGVGFTFEDAYKPLTICIDNKKVSFFACSQAEFGVFKSAEDKFGYAWINHPQVNSIIQKAKQDSDYVFVLVHAGLENVLYPLPEWRSRYKELIDSGADCIIGGHPHVAQGYEIYKDKYIYYSLGNFFFELARHQNSSENDKGIMVVADVGQSIDIEVIPIVNIDRKISIDTDTSTQENLLNRSSIFSNEERYLSKINEIAEEFWHKYYIKYYTWGVDNSFMFVLKNRVRQILRLLGFKQFGKASGVRINDTLLLHNIQIETHRWIVERFLYNQNKKLNKF